MTGCFARPRGSRPASHQDLRRLAVDQASWSNPRIEEKAGAFPPKGDIYGLWQRTIPCEPSASAMLDSETRSTGAPPSSFAISRCSVVSETDVQRAKSLAQLGVVVAGLAHEIRNPLGGIRGAMQLLAADIGPRPSAKEYVDLVLREVDRLAKLLGQLLELRPRGPGKPEPVNVHRVLDHVMALADESARRQATRIVRFYDPSLPAVRGDPDALTQLFLNLVQNAVEAPLAGDGASPAQGRGRDSVILRARREPRHATFEIEDDGPGIAPAAHPPSSTRSSPRSRTAPASASPSCIASSPTTAVPSTSRADRGGRSSACDSRSRNEGTNERQRQEGARPSWWTTKLRRAAGSRSSLKAPAPAFARFGDNGSRARGVGARARRRVSTSGAGRVPASTCSSKARSGSRDVPVIVMTAVRHVQTRSRRCSAARSTT